MKRTKLQRIKQRKIRVRSGIFGTGDRPRITIFRSNRYTYTQAIDDSKRRTLESSSSRDTNDKQEKTKKTDVAKEVGKILAQKLMKKGIKKGLFDRGSYAYLGRVKAVAQGLREGGLAI